MSNIKFALFVLKQGGKVRRRDWKPDVYLNNVYDSLVCVWKMDPRESSLPVMVKTLPIEDVLATDWEEYQQDWTAVDDWLPNTPKFKLFHTRIIVDNETHERKLRGKCYDDLIFKFDTPSGVEVTHWRPIND